MLGERLDWWEQHRCAVNSCPLICHISQPKERPIYYSQKSQLPVIKEDLTLVKWSGELLDFNDVYSTILQDVCKLVDEAFKRFTKGDKDGKRSGKPSQVAALQIQNIRKHALGERPLLRLVWALKEFSSFLKPSIFCLLFVID
jgi:hypothetical protein